jgi:hypothetical protein
MKPKIIISKKNEEVRWMAVNDESIVDIPDNNDENMNCNGDKCYV